MGDAKQEVSTTRRVLHKATKLSMFLVIVGLGIQTGFAFFEPARTPVDASKQTSPEGDLGAWTFAGEGLSVAMRTVEVADLESELAGSQGAEVVDPAIKKGEAEARILDVLATLPPTKKDPSGRRGWRQTLSGIEIYAETCRTGEGERLAVARAAWSSTGAGLTLLEIRPEATSGGNEKSAKRSLPAPKGATEMAQRVTSKGVVTGSLFTSKESLEVAGKAMTTSLNGDGWSVEPIDLGESVSARTMACRRGDEQMQVVLFRDEAGADQTMIMCVRE